MSSTIAVDLVHGWPSRLSSPAGTHSKRIRTRNSTRRATCNANEMRRDRQTIGAATLSAQLARNF
jgi:hypothetical protein